MSILTPSNKTSPIKFLANGETAFNDQSLTCGYLGETYCRLSGLTDNETFTVDVDLDLTDVMTNGDFSDGSTGWTVNAGWSVSGGKATHTAGTANTLEQAALTVGKIYRVQYDIVDYVAGQVTTSFGTTTGVARSSNGTFVDIRVCAGTTALKFTPSSTFDGAVTNVVAEDITDLSFHDITSIAQPDFDDNSEWSLGAGWSITGGVLQGSAVAPSIGTLSDTVFLSKVSDASFRKIYKVTYTVTNYSAGSVFPIIGNPNLPLTDSNAGDSASGNGTVTTYIESFGLDGSVNQIFAFYSGTGGFTGDISSVYVHEVCEDEYWVKESTTGQAYRIQDENVYRLSKNKTLVSFQWGAINLVRNGQFKTSIEHWSPNAAGDWIYKNGKMFGVSGKTGVVDHTVQNFQLQPSTTYTLTYTLSDRTAGTVTPVLGGSSGTGVNVNGTYTETFTTGASPTNIVRFNQTSGFDGGIDDVQLYVDITDCSTWQIATMNKTNLISDSGFDTPLKSGTTTSTTANKLVDAGASFTDGTIQVGMLITNTTDGTNVYITAIDNATTLSVSADRFTISENYEIFEYTNDTTGSGVNWIIQGNQAATGSQFAQRIANYNTSATNGVVYMLGATFNDITLVKSTDEFYLQLGDEQIKTITEVGVYRQFTTATVDITENAWQIGKTNQAVTGSLDDALLQSGVLSECICVGTHDCTTLLTWTNDEDAFGEEYGDTTAGLTDAPIITMSLRVRADQGGLKSPRYPNDEEYFVSSSGVVTTQFARSYKVSQLYVDEQPEYIHDILRLGLIHDTFKIDGVEYKKLEDDYDPEWDNPRGRRLARVLLELRLATEDNTNRNCS